MLKTVHDIELYKEMMKNTLRHFAEVPADELNEFSDSFELRFYPKNTVIIAPGNTDIKGYFIVKGLVRMYYIINNNEITSDFRDTNSFFLNGYTVFTGEKNFDYFTAMEETICLVVEWEKLEMMLNKYHSLERMGRKIVEWHFIESMRVSHNSLFMNTEERYNVFMKECPELTQRVPLKYIASYLGIAQETLSRLRHKHK